MIRGVIGRVSAWLSQRFGGESGASETTENEDEPGFVPSRLDASVLEAHGMETTAAERELTQLQGKAEQLEEQDRRN